MKCPLCKKKLLPFTDPASVGDLYCPTEVYFSADVPDPKNFKVNKLTSTHYLYDTTYKESYVDLPPYRMVFCPNEILCCHFKGVVGMQFEHLFALPPQKVTLKNVNRIIERMKSLIIFT